jgi:hypothetical protein
MIKQSRIRWAICVRNLLSHAIQQTYPLSGLIDELEGDSMHAQEFGFDSIATNSSNQWKPFPNKTVSARSLQRVQIRYECIQIGPFTSCSRQPPSHADIWFAPPDVPLGSSRDGGARCTVIQRLSPVPERTTCFEWNTNTTLCFTAWKHILYE